MFSLVNKTFVNIFLNNCMSFVVFPNIRNFINFGYVNFSVAEDFRIECHDGQ